MGLAHGKHEQRIRAGHVPSSANHFLTLNGNSAVQQFDFGADSLRVGRKSFQTHGDARGRSFVSIHPRDATQIVHDKIHVTVAVKIGHGNRVVNAALIGPPGRSDVLKFQIAQVVKRHDRHVQARIKAHMLHQFFSELLARQRLPGSLDEGGALSRTLARPDQRFRVSVLHVLGMAGRDQQVLIAVQVHVDKYRLPGPLRGFQAAEVGNFRITAVAPIEKKRVAHDLRPVLDFSDRQKHRSLSRQLPFPEPQVAAQHINHEEIQVAIEVNVREVHPH